MYVIAAILAISGAAIIGYITIKAAFLWILLVGAYQTWGGHFLLRAYSYSLSRTSLVISLRFVITVALAAIFLGEASLYTNPWIPAGAVLLLIATMMLGKKEKKEGGEGVSKGWLISVFLQIAIAGSAGFFLKVFASELEVPKLTFLSYWYFGAVLGAAPMLLLERDDGRVLFRKGGLWVLLAGTLIITQLVIEYTAYQLMPLAIATPMLAFGTTLGAVLVGLFVFKEINGLTRVHLLGFLIG